MASDNSIRICNSFETIKAYTKVDATSDNSGHTMALPKSYVK